MFLENEYEEKNERTLSDKKDNTILQAVLMCMVLDASFI